MTIYFCREKVNNVAPKRVTNVLIKTASAARSFQEFSITNSLFENELKSVLRKQLVACKARNKTFSYYSNLDLLSRNMKQNLVFNSCS